LSGDYEKQGPENSPDTQHGQKSSQFLGGIRRLLQNQNDEAMGSRTKSRKLGTVNQNNGTLNPTLCQARDRDWFLTELLNKATQKKKEAGTNSTSKKQ